MKKIIALLLSLLLAFGCTALAEDFTAGLEGELSFSDGMDIIYVSSFEEAAQYYTGEVPALTPPEGFRLKEILVNDFGLTAYYTTAAPENETPAEGEEATPVEAQVISNFEFSIYQYGANEGFSYYSLSDGALTETDASMVTLYEAGDVIYSADVYTTKGAIYFYFEGLDNTQIEAVLTGLQI